MSAVEPLIEGAAGVVAAPAEDVRRRQILLVCATATAAIKDKHAIADVVAEMLPLLVDIAATEWPDVVPVGEELPAVPMLDPDLLPAVLRDFTVDVAERHCVPLDLVFAPLVVALGTAIGRRLLVAVRELSDWYEVPNVWGATVAAAGMGKSPAARPVWKMVGEVEGELTRRWARDEEERKPRRMVFETRRRLLAQEIKDAVTAGTPTVDIEKKLIEVDRELAALDVPKPRLRIADATPETVMDILRGAPGGLLCIRDELSGFLAGLSKQGREHERALYVEGWNGRNPHTMERRQAQSAFVPAIALAVFGTIQPGPMRELVANSTHGGAADGFVQRFQVVVWPDRVPYIVVDRSPNRDAANRVRMIFDELVALPVEDPAQEPAVSFASRDTVERLIKWAQSEIPEPPGLAEWRNKAPKLFCALALICHVCRYGAKGAVRMRILEEDAVKAFRLVDHLYLHASRVYSGTDRLVADARYIGHLIKSGELGSEFSTRQLMRRSGRRFMQAAAVEAALDLLRRHGWVRSRMLETGGRPSERWEISPRILAGAGAP